MCKLTDEEIEEFAKDCFEEDYDDIPFTDTILVACAIRKALILQRERIVAGLKTESLSGAPFGRSLDDDAYWVMARIAERLESDS